MEVARGHEAAGENPSPTALNNSPSYLLLCCLNEYHFCTLLVLLLLILMPVLLKVLLFDWHKFESAVYMYSGAELSSKYNCQKKAFS